VHLFDDESSVLALAVERIGGDEATREVAERCEQRAEGGGE